MLRDRPGPELVVFPLYRFAPFFKTLASFLDNVRESFQGKNSNMSKKQQAAYRC